MESVAKKLSRTQWSLLSLTEPRLEPRSVGYKHHCRILSKKTWSRSESRLRVLLECQSWQRRGWCWTQRACSSPRVAGYVSIRSTQTWNMSHSNWRFSQLLELIFQWISQYPSCSSILTLAEEIEKVKSNPSCSEEPEWRGWCSEQVGFSSSATASEPSRCHVIDNNDLLSFPGGRRSQIHRCITLV